MDQLFLSSQFKADDLLGYSRKMEALGRAISALGFHEKNNHGTEALSMEGEELGMIVADYAKTINKALHSAYWVLDGFFERDDSSQEQKGAPAKADDQNAEAPSTDADQQTRRHIKIA